MYSAATIKTLKDISAQYQKTFEFLSQNTSDKFLISQVKKISQEIDSIATFSGNALIQAIGKDIMAKMGDDLSSIYEGGKADGAISSLIDDREKHREQSVSLYANFVYEYISDKDINSESIDKYTYRIKKAFGIGKNNKQYDSSIRNLVRKSAKSKGNLSQLEKIKYLCSKLVSLIVKKKPAITEYLVPKNYDSFAKLGSVRISNEVTFSYGKSPPEKKEVEHPIRNQSKNERKYGKHGRPNKRIISHAARILKGRGGSHSI